MHWAVLVFVPLCGAFSPSVVSVRRNQSSHRSAVTKRKRGDEPGAGKNTSQKPEEVSELIRAAAWSIVTLSNHVLVKASEGGLAPAGSIGAKDDEAADDLLADVDITPPKLRPSSSSKPASADKQSEAVTGGVRNDPAAPIEKKEVSDIKSPTGKPKMQWIKRRDDTPRTGTTASKKAADPTPASDETIIGSQKPALSSMTPTLQDEPTMAQVDPPRPSLGTTWSELLAKEDSLLGTSAAATTVPQLESIPTKEEIRMKRLQEEKRLKLLQDENERKDTLPSEEAGIMAMEGNDDDDSSIVREKESMVHDDISTLSSPPISDSISSSFGKPLPVTTAGLPPLRQWPKPEKVGNNENAVAS
jgi:hypothetical protein